MIAHGTALRVIALQGGQLANKLEVTTSSLVRLMGGYFLLSDRTDTINAPNVSMRINDSYTVIGTTSFPLSIKGKKASHHP